MYGFCYWECGFLPQHLSFIRQETLVYCCIPTTKKNIWNKEGIEWIFVGWVMMNHFFYFLFINILILWWISAATYRQKFRYDWQGIFLVFSVFLVMKVLVAQSCLTLCDPMDWSLPGSSVFFPSSNTRVACHFLFQGLFLTQGSNPVLLHCRQILYHLSQQGKSFNLRQQLVWLKQRFCSPRTWWVPFEFTVTLKESQKHHGSFIFCHDSISQSPGPVSISTGNSKGFVTFSVAFSLFPSQEICPVLFLFFSSFLSDAGLQLSLFSASGTIHHGLFPNSLPVEQVSLISVLQLSKEQVLGTDYHSILN